MSEDDPVERAPYAVYVEHLKRGELAYQYSPSARQAVFFPRVVSPFDAGERLEWRISRGLGTVYSSTAVAGRGGATYNVSLIDCDEGFRLMSRVDGVAAESVRIGMRVRLRVIEGAQLGEDPLPVFVPLTETS
jgi:uncharacterized OB-fold protein